MAGTLRRARSEMRGTGARFTLTFGRGGVGEGRLSPGPARFTRDPSSPVAAPRISRPAQGLEGKHTTPRPSLLREHGPDSPAPHHLTYRRDARDQTIDPHQRLRDIHPTSGQRCRIPSLSSGVSRGGGGGACAAAILSPFRSLRVALLPAVCGLPGSISLRTRALTAERLTARGSKISREPAHEGGEKDPGLGEAGLSCERSGEAHIPG